MSGGSHLARILEDKRRRLDRGDYAAPPAGSGGSDGGRFVAALREPGARVIAEIKAGSPSAGEILASPEGAVDSLAAAYARGGAAAISVVTEEDHFGGQPRWLPRVKEASELPVLMKDFFLDERQLDHALALGADAVLLIAAALPPEELAAMRRGARDRGLAVVAEAHDEEELLRAAAVDPDVLAINARDLATFRVDLAAAGRLGGRIPPGPVRLAESGIRGRTDVLRLAAAGFEAFLVGESLLRAGDPERALRSLLS
ncbi:MAG: indole-3-glycerol-phosphate synthase [Thermoanaerobaculia bacterium]